MHSYKKLEGQKETIVGDWKSMICEAEGKREK